jgi:cobalt-zinc-cadmium efflux system outer membrane protein
MRAHPQHAFSRLRCALALLFLIAAPAATVYAQAGSGAGAGAGSGSSGAAAGASGQGAAAGAGQGIGAAGPAGAHGAPGAPAASGDAASGPQAYAASAAPGIDPRKPPPAKPGALTLPQVLDRARAANPTLLAAEANLRSVRANEIQAAVRANPYLAVAGSDVTEDASAQNPYFYSVQVSRLFERGNKRGLRIQNAQATTAQTAAQLQDTIRQTVLQVKTAFTHMLFAKQSRDLSRAQLTDFRHEVEISHDRYKAGDLSQLDFERLDLQLGAFESDVANDEIALQQASDQLQTLMGIASPAPSFDITGDIIPPAVAQTREQLIQQALATRPDIAAARSGVDVAQSAYKLAVANGTADPTVEAEYDRTPESTSGASNSAGFNVNIPLRIFDRNQGNKEVARLGIDTARLTLTATRNQVSSDVDQAWIAYVQAKTLSDRFGNHYLDESADVLSIARYAFDHGGLALIDYLDSLRDARTATSNALDAYQQTWIAIHQLSESSAVDLIP